MTLITLTLILILNLALTLSRIVHSSFTSFNYFSLVFLCVVNNESALMPFDRWKNGIGFHWIQLCLVKLHE